MRVARGDRRAGRRGIIAVVTAGFPGKHLQELERLTPDLEELVEAGAIAGFEHAAQVPAISAAPAERQARLPRPEELEAALAEATKGTPFRAGVFAPFLADVERARHARAVTPADCRGTAAGPLIEGLLHGRGRTDRPSSLFRASPTPGGCGNGRQLPGSERYLIDLKQEATALAVAQRERILVCLAVAARFCS